MSSRKLRNVILLSCVLIIVYGCDNPTPVPTPEPTSTAIDSEAIQILRKAADIVERLQTYYVVFGAAPGTLGVFEAPDRCRIESERDGTTIQIADRAYQQRPGDSFFVEQVPPNGFSPSDGPVCDGFLRPLPTEVPGVTAARLIGDENLDGHKAVHIDFSYSPSVFGPFPVGTGTTEDVESSIWIERDTNFVIKLVPNTTEPEAYLEYSHFNEPVTPPILEPAPDRIVTVTPRPVPTFVQTVP